MDQSTFDWESTMPAQNSAMVTARRMVIEIIEDEPAAVLRRKTGAEQLEI